MKNLKMNFLTVITMGLVSIFMISTSFTSQAQIKGCEKPCNLATNGNFESSAPGFSSDMSIGCSGCSTNCVQVVSSFNQKCNLWPNAGSGSGKFLAVDGHITGGSKMIWKQDVKGCAGMTYTFSFRAANVYGSSGAENVTFMVNNMPAPVGSAATVSVNGAYGSTWPTYTITFTTTTAVTSIGLRQDVGAQKADIGIDDIFFGFCTCACR